MCIFISQTSAANKSAEQHEEPSEQDSFNHLLYKVLRLTSEQVQDLNDWMEHQGTPNVHELIAQSYRRPHALKNNLKFIKQGKTCYIQSNVMFSLFLMISYIKHRQYSAKSKYFGPLCYIQIDPQDYDEWRMTPPEEEIHFSGPYDEDEYQNLISDDNQVIQQENSCSEHPEPLSYSLFQSHFQGSSTSNTQKTFLPKPTWERPSKDQQQMIIDHKPNSGSPHLSTPNKSPSPSLHLPTPQQTAKPQQVHTHQSDESTTDTIKTETTPSDPLLAMAHQSINTSDDAAPDISNVLSVKRSSQIQVCQHYLFQHANHTNQQMVDHGANEGLAGPDMRGIYRTYRKIKIQDIDNHEVADLDVVTAATLLNTSQEKVIGIFNEHAYLWKGSSIHSSGQLEWLQTKWGAMDTLISDGGKYDISKGVIELLHSLFIQDYQSESYHQDQNKTENCFGPAKRYTNTVMNTSGCLACCWLLCLQYICVVLHHLASPTLQGICPVQALQGTTPDISFMLHSSFYEPVYYRIDSSEPDLNFPSSSNEDKGYWVGFSNNPGDHLTWRILTEDTHKIIICSGIQSALRTTTNQCLASPSGEGTTLPFSIPYPQPSKNSLPLDPFDESTPTFEHFVNSQSGEDEDNPIHMANIDIPNLLGRSFLFPPEDNGEHHMAKIIDIDDHGPPLEDIKFKLKINKGTDAEEDSDSLFKFRDIVAHQGPPESTDPDQKGSKYNVMVEWESGEVTYEPLTLISKDGPITCAVYAKKHDLLDTTGWKHLKRYARTSKRLIRAVKQSRIRQVRASARYQHGFQVPKDYNDAIRLDKENSNTHWQDAMDLELTQIHEYKVFKDTGKAQFHNGKAVTPDGFQKARLVADGHLTKEPVESIYSGVVSLRSLRMVVFLSQLNDLETWGADVGNAYLEAYTDQKLCIIAGPEFKELQGHLLIMIKALHGTHSGGARWHDRLFDILQELKFKPSKADPDVWMRPEPGGTCYEYIAVYVDDLAIAAKDPIAFCNELKEKYNLKLKGVGPLEYHLGCTYKKDPDGTLAADPRRYINKILESYERMFKEKQRKSRPPLEGGDHPELHTPELCDEHQTNQEPWTEIVHAVESFLVQLAMLLVFITDSSLTRLSQTVFWKTLLTE